MAQQEGRARAANRPEQTVNVGPGGRIAGPRGGELSAAGFKINGSTRQSALTRRAASLNDSPVQVRLNETATYLNLEPSRRPQEASNRTGLPDRLKVGIEALSGMSMDDVRVHRNSARPARLQAHAYAQGSDIHLAPGQERHLAHEAWHVVQQKQGRVRATRQLKGTGLNDDLPLEREADAMALAAQRIRSGSDVSAKAVAAAGKTVQRVAVHALGGAFTAMKYEAHNEGP